MKIIDFHIKCLLLINRGKLGWFLCQILKISKEFHSNSKDMALLKFKFRLKKKKPFKPNIWLRLPTSLSHSWAHPSASLWHSLQYWIIYTSLHFSPLQFPVISSLFCSKRRRMFPNEMFYKISNMRKNGPFSKSRMKFAL